MIHKEQLKTEQNIQIIAISNKKKNRNRFDITPLPAKMTIVNVGQKLMVCV